MPENQPRLFRFLRLTGLYIVVALSRVWVTGYPGLGKFYFARLLKQQSLKIYSWIRNTDIIWRTVIP